MFDLICLGSISMDLYFRGKSLTYKDNRFQLAIGGKYSPDFFYESIGGGAVNVAIGVKKYGLKASVLGKIGKNSFKKVIHEKLENEGIHHDYCQIEDDYYNVSSILLTETGERSIIHFASLHQNLINDKEVLKQVTNAKALYLGNLPDISLTERIDILSNVKRNGILTFVNLGVKDCRRPIDQLDNLIKKIDILIINGHEFAELTKQNYEKINFKTNIIKPFRLFDNKIIIITEGSNGSYSYTNDKVFYQEAIKPYKIIDTTGAGDAYTAGFISRYLVTQNIEESMNRGARYAAKILSKIGAN